MTKTQVASGGAAATDIEVEQKECKTGVVPFLRCRGHCNPLWAVFPPLQVVLSFACSVASLSRCPSHYLPGHHHFRGGDLADYPFGWGSPSTWLAARTALRDTPSVISGRNREFEVPNNNRETKHNFCAPCACLCITRGDVGFPSGIIR